MARPRIDIELPREPFTTQTLEQRYPHLSITLIHKRLKEWIDLGQVKRVGKRPQESAQRKAWYLYEPVGISDRRNVRSQRLCGPAFPPTRSLPGGQIEGDAGW